MHSADSAIIKIDTMFVRHQYVFFFLKIFSFVVVFVCVVRLSSC